MTDFQAKAALHFAKIKCYFNNAQQEIAIKNLGLLRIVGLTNAALVLIFCGITALIIPGWQITIYDVLYFFIALSVYFLATVYKNKCVINGKFVSLLCYLLEAALLAFIILIDTRLKPDAPGSYMPILSLALPAVFILPFRFVYPLLLVFECLYIAAVSLTKTPYIARYDVLHALIGLVTSIPVAHIIMRLRVDDYEAKIKYKLLSTRDSLSGVLNKAACTEAIQFYLAATAPDTGCGLIILDIDDFKRVNDHLGHQAGDAFLSAFGQLLANAFRSQDVVGRFGGDEFLVLVNGVRAPAILEEKCQMILARMPTATGNGQALEVTCSIGAVYVSGQSVDFDSLFAQTDNALYQAKHTGKNRYVVRPYQ